MSEDLFVSIEVKKRHETGVARYEGQNLASEPPGFVQGQRVLAQPHMGLGYGHLVVRRLLHARLVKLKDAEEPPGRWLASYWTALAYSQLVLFSGDERGKSYVQLAQHYSDEAWELRPPGDSGVEADHHALYGLIKTVWATTYPEDSDGHHADRARLLAGGAIGIRINHGLNVRKDRFVVKRLSENRSALR